MENPQSSVLVDPLADISLVSLFPRTFNTRDFDPESNPRYNDPLEAFGAHLEAMALKNPERLLEQANSILDGLESSNADNLGNVKGQDSVGDVPGVNNVNLLGDTKNLKHTRDENTEGDFCGVNQENLKGKRPGLGRKKARFSMKPNSSQPKEWEPYVDVTKLSDPEDFFSALEKQEDAKNEWRRQSGKPLMDLDQNLPRKVARPVRPGLLGKLPTYKHHHSRTPFVDDKTFLSSQDTLSQDLSSPAPSDDGMQPEHTSQIPLSLTKDRTVPIGQDNAGKERPSVISDELPFREDKDDECDEIIGMLQDRFKPVEISKSCLAGLNNVLESELRTIGECVLGSEDNTSDLHNIVSAIGKETTLGSDPVKKHSGHSSASPKPPKSPYSSISLLKARLFQSRKEKDTFSALDLDVTPLVKATSNPTTGDNDTSKTNLNSLEHESECNVVNKDIHDSAALKFTSSESNKGNSMMPGVSSDFIEHTVVDDGPLEHGEMDTDPKSPLNEKDSGAVNSMETVKDISKTIGVNSNGVMQDELDHARDQNPKSAEHSIESDVVQSKDVCDIDAENIAPCLDTMRDNSERSDIAPNTSPHVELDHNLVAKNRRDRVLEDNPSAVFDDAVISANEDMEPDLRVVDKDIQGSNMEKTHHNKEQATVSATKNLESPGGSIDHDKLFTADAIGDLDHDRSSRSSALEKTRKDSSKMAKNKKSKARKPAHGNPPAKVRAAGARKLTRDSIFCTRNISLAGCGTQWETGMRRSTRIRSRPLEYWNGEKQLYGRIHDGLITVVGTKYYSPEKGTGKAVLKVKSYVSEEHKDIVEWAALH